VHVAADVGLRDSTAWWFWQPRPEGIAIIDYYEASGVHVDHYLGMLHDKGYDYHEIWLPFDAKAKTLATRRSTVEQFQAPSIVRPDIYTERDRLPIRIVPRLAIQHGIDAARLVMAKCWFDVDNCAQGLDALRSYRRQWHEHTRTFSDKPMHDWASNAADGFRYLAIVAQKSVAMISDEEYTPDGEIAPGTGALKSQDYTLDQLYKDRDDGNWRNSIIRI
jgi:phage terminase large subunit